MGRPRYEHVNPLDTLILFLQALSILDRHVSREVLIQRVIDRAGDTPNVIPVEAFVRIWIRAGEETYLESIVRRVRECAEGTALTTGATLEVQDAGKPTLRMIQNLALENVARRKMEQLGIPFHIDEMSPYPFATDFGNITHVLPGIELLVGIPRGFNFHTAEAIKQRVSPDAFDAMIRGAKVLATTAIDLFSDPSLAVAAKEELEGYRAQNFRNAMSWHTET